MSLSTYRRLTYLIVHDLLTYQSTYIVHNPIAMSKLCEEANVILLSERVYLHCHSYITIIAA